MGSRQKAKIEELEQKSSEFQLKIQGLNNDLELAKKQKEEEISIFKQEFQIKEDGLRQERDQAVTALKNQIEALDHDIKEKKIQLDRKELKKLAQAFGEQEDLRNKDQERWLKYLFIVALGLVGYAIFSIYLTNNKPWLDRISYYAIDIILISAVWFCASQFADATKLKYDYGNRKTLAQSFHNILNNLAEDESIRSKFIEKTTDVLCAPVGAGGKEPILTKKVLKDVAEIVGAATK